MGMKAGFLGLVVDLQNIIWLHICQWSNIFHVFDYCGKGRGARFHRGWKAQAKEQIMSVNSLLV